MQKSIGSPCEPNYGMFERWRWLSDGAELIVHFHSVISSVRCLKQTESEIMSSERQMALVGKESLDPSTSIVVKESRDCAIELKRASVLFPIGPYSRGSLKSNVMRLLGAGREASKAPDYVNALTDVNLSVSKGERVGLIGSNGSGKSTLLRLIAGIYPLQSGEVKVQGRIGTLLDISLGFESESTGRENIYYRGMAMGISPKKIRKMEQEVIDFAQLGAFVDLPMRTYSAGMWVRLGFAISTQFSPDVLLVDEVFGAGDAEFARRASGRMMRIVSHAGIVVIVTHDLNLVRTLCTRAVWIRAGTVYRDGPPSVVVKEYEDFSSGHEH